MGEFGRYGRTQEVCVSVSQCSWYLCADSDLQRRSLGVQKEDLHSHYQALNQFLSCSLQAGGIVTLTVLSAGTLNSSHGDESMMGSRVSIRDADISEIRTVDTSLGRALMRRQGIEELLLQTAPPR